MSESAPAGWYPDSSAPGYERWWDGSAWSHATRPIGAGTAAPAAPTDQPGYPAQSYGGQSYPGQSYPGTGYGASSPYTAYPQQAAMDQAAVYFHAKRTPDGEFLAGVGMRFVARILDGLITGAVSLVLSWGALRDYLDAVVRISDEAARTGDSNPFALYQDEQAMQALLTMTLIGLLLTAVYEVVFIALLGATPGKLACGLRVRRYDRPGKPGWGTSILRWLIMGAANLICSAIYILDCLWCLWDPRRQCLHDKAAATVVVKTRP